MIKKVMAGVIGLLVIGTAMAVVLTPFSATAENKGSSDILLEGGSRGKVPFPHLRHQTKLEDCQICHTLFPREKGGIEKLKAQGQLIKKQIMNKHCIQCHRKLKRAGDSSGPITCSKCHIRNKQG